jgi:ABC-type glycerol-3-phosphate transport system permease component
MASTAPDAWIVWVVISLFLIICFGIILWIAYDSPKDEEVVVSTPTVQVTNQPTTVRPVETMAVIT